MNGNGYYAGVDLGAGSGAKIGLFSDVHTMAGETLLPAEKYGDSAKVGVLPDATLQYFVQ